MADILSIVIPAFLSGALIAWYLRGAGVRAVVAGLEARLEAAERSLLDRVRELGESKSAHVRTLEQHREESQRRAAAEERAARISDLEIRLQQRDGLLSQHLERIATLETQLVETLPRSPWRSGWRQKQDSNKRQISRAVRTESIDVAEMM